MRVVAGTQQTYIYIYTYIHIHVESHRANRIVCHRRPEQTSFVDVITFDMYDAFNFTESIPPRYLELVLELKIKNLNFSVKIFDI